MPTGPGVSDRHGLAQRTRFLPDSVLGHFDRRLACADGDSTRTTPATGPHVTSRGIRRRTKDLWRRLR